MPELPEVEVLVRHLAPLLRGRRIRGVRVLRARIVRPHPPAEVEEALRGATIIEVRRRGKFLLFEVRPAGSRKPRLVAGHLGMSGRMFLQPTSAPLPKHTAVLFDLGRLVWVFEDTRYFGRVSFDLTALDELGPEPLEAEFSPEYLAGVLRHSRQPIKVKLLDQSLVAGLGNLYASEALFVAEISPRKAARRLRSAEIVRLRDAVRHVLEEAIRLGGTLPLDFAGTGARDGLFYYGRSPNAPEAAVERLRVYDRAWRPCVRCGTTIRRMVQAGRSTYFCPRCQH